MRDICLFVCHATLSQAWLLDGVLAVISLENRYLFSAHSLQCQEQTGNMSFLWLGNVIWMTL